MPTLDATLWRWLVGRGYGRQSDVVTMIASGNVSVDDTIITNPDHLLADNRSEIAVGGEVVAQKDGFLVVWNTPSTDESDPRLVSDEALEAQNRIWYAPLGVPSAGAEGITILSGEIEDAEDVAWLQALTCDYLIGFDPRVVAADEHRLMDLLQKDVDARTIVVEPSVTANRSTLQLVSVRAPSSTVESALRVHLGTGCIIKRTRVGPFHEKDIASGTWIRLSASDVATLKESVASGIDDSTPLSDVYEEIVRSASN